DKDSVLVHGEMTAVVANVGNFETTFVVTNAGPEKDDIIPFEMVEKPSFPTENRNGDTVARGRFTFKIAAKDVAGVSELNIKAAATRAFQDQAGATPSDFVTAAKE